MLDSKDIAELRLLCRDVKSAHRDSHAVRTLVTRVNEVCDVTERARAGLTPRELSVLDTITEFVRDRGHRPSMQQVADELGIRKATVHEYVWRLRAKGLLLKGIGGKRRAIAPA